jgi:hypothetical protein
MSNMGPVHIAIRNIDGSPVGSYNYGPISPIIGTSDEETMIDDISKSRLSKRVIHVRRKLIRKNLDAEEYYYGSSPNTIWNVAGPSAHWLSWNPYGEITQNNIQVDWPESESALIRKAKNAFYDVNKVDSLLNTAEAPELVTSISPMYRKIMGVQLVQNTRNWRSILRTLRNNSKPSFGILCGGYLYYAFGVAPLISDMRRISSSVSSYKKKLEDALKKAGTVETVHVRDSGEVFGKLIADQNTGSLPAAYGEDTQLDGSWWHTKPYSLETPLRVCTIRGVRSSKFNTKLFGELDYLAKTFGVTGPASFAWERVKFSFVFDWFVDLSDILNKLDNTLTGGDKNIQDITLSTRWRVLCPLIKHLRAVGQQSSADGQQTGSVELHYYDRKPIQDNIEVGLSGRFGKKQGLLSAALLGQMVANLKKKSIGR